MRDFRRRVASRARHTIDVGRHRLWFRDPARRVAELSTSAALEEVQARRPLLQRILDENILPFWYPRIIDEDEGGYRLNHDLRGEWMGPAVKRIVSQARVVWFSSRLHNAGYSSGVYLEAAHHGYRFIKDHMWDDEAGGFYWEVDSAGRPQVRDKYLRGQAFALFALAEYAIASSAAEAETLALQLFQLISEKAHDPVHGGYPEVLGANWDPLPSVSAGRFSHKTLNTHLHLMEAMTGYIRVAPTSRVYSELIELIAIMTNATVDKHVAAGVSHYHPNWAPTTPPVVSYGHDLERVWMVADACEAADVPNSPFVQLYDAIFRNALKHGYDAARGGFYLRGRLGRHAGRRGKHWWAQAEGLVCSLVLFRLTGDPFYAHWFLETLDWIVGYQVDWEHGDWYQIVGLDGRPSGVKAGPWKTPYHNGRAMLICLEALGPGILPLQRLGITR